MSPASSNQVLCNVRYGSVEGIPQPVNDVLELPVIMTKPGSGSFVETWNASGDVTVETYGDIAVSHDGETLLCAGFVPHQDRLTEAVKDIHERALSRAVDLGYPNVYRMWNMIGHINRSNRDGLEVYRDFCLGRALAFEEMELGTSRNGNRLTRHWSFLLLSSHQLRRGPQSRKPSSDACIRISAPLRAEITQLCASNHHQRFRHALRLRYREHPRPQHSPHR